VNINSKLPFGITWQGLVAGVIVGAVFSGQLSRVTRKIPKA
jgi:hypothetical protein